MTKKALYLKVMKNLTENKPNKELYDKWKNLTNYHPTDLKKFRDSEEGKVAIVSNYKTDDLGEISGKESISLILKMKPIGKTFSEANKNWTPKMWSWAKNLSKAISELKSNKDPLYDQQGNPTKKALSLWVWGHDPEKAAILKRGLEQGLPGFDYTIYSDKDKKQTEDKDITDTRDFC